ncbi:MAG: EamA family transporter [Pseudomonadota bacterium]
MIEIWLVTLCWGLSFPLARFLVAELDPLWITTFRFLLGGLALFLFFLFKGEKRKLKIESVRLIIFLAIFEFFLVYFFYLTSIKYLPASKVAALTLTTPVIVLILDSIFKRKMPLLKILIPFIFATLGAVVLYDKSASHSADKYNQIIGFICIIISNTSFAFANVILRSRMNSSNIFVTGSAQIVAGIMSMIASILVVGAPNRISTERFAILIYLSVVATGIGFWFWNRSVNKLGALYPGLISNLKAPIAALLSVLILKESVPVIMWIGISLLIISASFAKLTIEHKINPTITVQTNPIRESEASS